MVKHGNNKTMNTAEEILTESANEKSYETWGELMYDTHEQSQVEYTVEAMKIYAQQFTEKIKLLEEEIEYLKKSKDIPF